MRLEQQTLFRKIIIPWYDSEGACLLTITLLFSVFLFSAVGLSVAREVAEYNRHVWVPILVMVLSIGVIVSITIRLANRYYLIRSLRKK